MSGPKRQGHLSANGRAGRCVNIGRDHHLALSLVAYEAPMEAGSVYVLPLLHVYDGNRDGTLTLTSNIPEADKPTTHFCMIHPPPRRGVVDCKRGQGLKRKVRLPRQGTRSTRWSQISLTTPMAPRIWYPARRWQTLPRGRGQSQGNSDPVSGQCRIWARPKAHASVTDVEVLHLCVDSPLLITRPHLLMILGRRRKSYRCVGRWRRYEHHVRLRSTRSSYRVDDVIVYLVDLLTYCETP